MINSHAQRCNIVWSIIQNDLPVLVLEIERILADDKYSTSEKT